ncbi:uncharacterized protein LOC129598388 [Paramacrobiotus metropolitanus]|uniref:uncharacterized protein LOC129598388 n=1 Tax=Paramacrobiotus metropolitanus TaxID=2943436 RepID=UPI002445F31E|nr:uncharacterized protein LOC129598388 [Paramacrobiotus metropolitanus]
MMTHFGVMDMPTMNAAIDDLLTLCDITRYMALQRPGIRLRHLHLNRFNFDLSLDTAGVSARTPECALHRPHLATAKPMGQWDCRPLQEFIAVCGSVPCATLLLTNCDVHLVCSYFFRQRVELISVTIKLPRTRLPIGPDFSGALWDVMDATLPAPDAQKLQELVDRVKGCRLCGTGADQELAKVVCKMLCALQAADPRPAAHYHGKQWCVDGLQGLQWEKLSRIARHFLANLRAVTSQPSGW